MRGRETGPAFCVAYQADGVLQYTRKIVSSPGKKDRWWWREIRGTFRWFPVW